MPVTLNKAQTRAFFRLLKKFPLPIETLEFEESDDEGVIISLGFEVAVRYIIDMNKYGVATSIKKGPYEGQQIQSQNPA